MDLPGSKVPLVVIAAGAPRKPYVQALSLNGVSLAWPVLRHEQIVQGGTLEFTMSETPQPEKGPELSGGAV